MTWPDPPQIPPGGPRLTPEEIRLGPCICPRCVVGGQPIQCRKELLPELLPRERIARLFDVPEELLR